VVPQMMPYLVVGIGIRDKMVLQFLTEAFMAVPCVCYLMMQGRAVKDGVLTHSADWKMWLLLMPFAVCLNKIAEFVNVVSQLFTTNTVGNHMAELIVKYPFLISFLVIAVTPALCEEWIFRGILYHGYRKSGVAVATILTAFLFGLMHMNLNQFFYAFFVGLVFALVNEVTGSILPSVLLHLYINGRSVVFLYLAEKYPAGGDETYTAIADASVREMIPELLPGVLIALVCGIVLFVLLLLCNGRADRYRELFFRKSDGGEREAGSLWYTIISPELVIGILVCIAFMVWK